MKNAFKFFFVVAIMAGFLTACGGKTEQSSGGDSTAQEAPAVQEVAPDTAANAAQDSTAK